MGNLKGDFQISEFQGLTMLEMPKQGWEFFRSQEDGDGLAVWKGEKAAVVTHLKIELGDLSYHVNLKINSICK